MADTRALLEAGRSCVPGQLGAGEEEVFIQVIRRGDDDAGPACAPLKTDLAVGAWKLGPVARRPVREAVLEHRRARKHCGSFARHVSAAFVVEEREQRPDVSDQSVRRRQSAELLAVHSLNPEAVVRPSSEECVCALVPCLAPPLVAGPLEHRARCDQCPRRSPHHLVCRVVDVRSYTAEQVVRQRAARREAASDEQDPRLARQQRGLARVRELHSLHEVRSGAKQLEVAGREVGEVEPRLGVTLTAQAVERPQHARDSDVEVLHRARPVPAVPVVGRPEQLRPA